MVLLVASTALSRPVAPCKPRFQSLMAGQCSTYKLIVPRTARVKVQQRQITVPRASSQGDSGPNDDQDKAPELSARDLQMQRDFQSRLQEIESRPFYYGLVEGLKNEGLSRRALFGGLALVAVTGAIIGGGGSGGGGASMKLPLSYYVAEILACDLALTQARDYASEGEWIQYNTIRRRIADGAVKKTLEGVVGAAKLSGRDAEKARTIGGDFLELVDQMDYGKYTNQLPTQANYGDDYAKSIEEERKKKFSVNASIAVKLKLQELIALLPPDEVQYALSGGANGSMGSTATVPSPASL